MKIMVIGGAGFIGRTLVSSLLDQAHCVLVLDNFQFFAETEISSRQDGSLSIASELGLDRAEVARCDLMDKGRLAYFFESFAPDTVVYLAALPIVSAASQDLERAKHAMSSSLINLLETLRQRQDVTRLVYVSSSMCYGHFAADPMPEDGPTDPVNVYGGLKLAGEVLTRAYLKGTGTEHAIVRPTAVYGPGDRHRRVVRIFCENALQGKTLEIFDGNDTVMDFTFVEDTAAGLVLAATHPNAANETFNISYGKGRSLVELAETIRRYIPSTRLSVTPSSDPDRPRRGALSVEKARSMLGYNPKWPLDRGVARYLEHLTANRRGSGREAS